jgi:hypothetical protein
MKQKITIYQISGSYLLKHDSQYKGKNFDLIKFAITLIKYGKYGRALLEKPGVAQLVRTFLHLNTEFEGTLPRLQKPTPGPYTEPVESNPHLTS